MKRFAMFLVAVLCAGLVHADPVQQKNGALLLNADYLPGDDDKPVVVILHGTWMHHTSDLMSYLQELADYEGYPSLNVSLSLGISDRQSFIDCENDPVIMGSHQQSVDELKLWFDWLSAQGHDRFILIGHSRGGAQSALFYQTHKYPGIEQLVLIAPATYNQKQTEAQYAERYSKDFDATLAMFQAMENQTDALTEAPVLYCTFAKVSAEAFISYYTAEPNKHTPSLIADIDIPTLVFLGSEDNISHKLMEYEEEFFQNDKVSTHWIDGADHFFRDLYADEIFEQVMYGSDP